MGNVFRRYMIDLRIVTVIKLSLLVGFILARVKYTFSLKNKVERNIISWYKLMLSVQDLRQQGLNKTSCYV